MGWCVMVLLVNMDLSKPAGVSSATSTVTAIQIKSLEDWPIDRKGIPEAAMLDVILPRANLLAEGIELLEIIKKKFS